MAGMCLAKPIMINGKACSTTIAAGKGLVSFMMARTRHVYCQVHESKDTGKLDFHLLILYLQDKHFEHEDFSLLAHRRQKSFDFNNLKQVSCRTSFKRPCERQSSAACLGIPLHQTLL